MSTCKSLAPKEKQGRGGSRPLVSETERQRGDPRGKVASGSSQISEFWVQHKGQTPREILNVSIQPRSRTHTNHMFVQMHTTDTSKFFKVEILTKPFQTVPATFSLNLLFCNKILTHFVLGYGWGRSHKTTVKMDILQVNNCHLLKKKKQPYFQIYQSALPSTQNFISLSALI